MMVFSNLFIELTIRWNSVTEVYQIGSTGQLIPFVVSLGSLIKCLNDLWTTHLSKSFVSSLQICITLKFVEAVPTYMTSFS